MVTVLTGLDKNRLGCEPCGSSVVKKPREIGLNFVCQHSIMFSMRVVVKVK